MAPFQTDLRPILLSVLLLLAGLQLRAELRVETLASCICPGQATQAFEVTATGTAGPFTFTWTGPEDYASTVQNPEDISQIPVAGLSLDLSSGNYRYQLLDATGCTGALDFTIPTSIPPVATLREVWNINLGESATLEVQPAFVATSIQWTPGVGLRCDTCLTTQVTPLRTTRYTVVLTDAFGCVWEGETTVIVAEQEIYVPNAFSPNADGYNDFLTVYGSSSVQTIRRFEVYDRWGSTVYANEDQEVRWDGVWKGRQLPAGVYVYWLEWVDVRGKTRTESGEINLLR